MRGLVVMKIEITRDQFEILRRALSDSIEKFIGVSNAQEAYIRNIDNGMSQLEAKKQYIIDNRREWIYYVHEEKNALFCLYDELYSSPASSTDKESQ